MSVVSEFKQFAMRGNVVDLAVGVVIGAAFGKIVSSLVADLIMPIKARNRTIEVAGGKPLHGFRQAQQWGQHAAPNHQKHHGGGGDEQQGGIQQRPEL